MSNRNRILGANYFLQFAIPSQKSKNDCGQISTLSSNSLITWQHDNLIYEYLEGFIPIKKLLKIPLLKGMKIAVKFYIIHIKKIILVSPFSENLDRFLW